MINKQHLAQSSIVCDIKYAYHRMIFKVYKMNLIKIKVL